MSHEWLSFVWCSNSMSRNWCAWCKHCAFLASSLAILTSSPISQMNQLSSQSVSWLSALVSRSVQPIVSLQYGILLLHKNTTLFWLNDLLLTNVECLLLATKCLRVVDCDQVPMFHTQVQYPEERLWNNYNRLSMISVDRLAHQWMWLVTCGRPCSKVASCCVCRGLLTTWVWSISTPFKSPIISTVSRCWILSTSK